MPAATERIPGATARRTALRMLTNGVYVITARAGERCGAATVTWITQASFRPPLVIAAVRPDSNVFACLRDSGAAAIHLLARHQQDVARRFFAPTRAEDGGINGEPVTPGRTASPILDCAPAFVECRVRSIQETPGDHALVVLEVVEAVCRRRVEPLRLCDTPWEYGG